MAAHARLASGTAEDVAAAKKLLGRVVRDYPDAVYQCASPLHPQHRVADEAKSALYQISRSSSVRQ